MSWPRLARPPTTSRQVVGKVFPIRIAGMDQPDLPRPWPALQAGLALDRRRHIGVRLTIHQPIQSIAPGERRPNTRFMLRNPAHQIAGDAEIQRSIWSVRHDVNPACGQGGECDRQSLRKGLRGYHIRRPASAGRDKVVGGRDKTGHDPGARIGAEQITDWQTRQLGGEALLALAEGHSNG